MAEVVGSVWSTLRALAVAVWVMVVAVVGSAALVALGLALLEGFVAETSLPPGWFDALCWAVAFVTLVPLVVLRLADRWPRLAAALLYDRDVRWSVLFFGVGAAILAVAPAGAGLDTAAALWAGWLSLTAGVLLATRVVLRDV